MEATIEVTGLRKRFGPTLALDGMAFGVYEAVSAASKASQVAVVGTDGIPEAKKSVTDGQMKATVAEFPFDEGVLGVDMALRLIACQPIPPWVVSPQAVITADNVRTAAQAKVLAMAGFDRGGGPFAEAGLR